MADLVRIDPYTRQAWAGERLLELTPMQWRLLAVLAAQPGVTLAYPRLQAAIGGPGPVSASTVRVALSAVRMQLGDPCYVRTVLSVGLCFAAGLAEDIYLGREVADVCA